MPAQQAAALASDGYAPEVIVFHPPSMGAVTMADLDNAQCVAVLVSAACCTTCTATLYDFALRTAVPRDSHCAGERVAM